MSQLSLISDLRRVSAELGRDRLLVQGGGGNTSLKCGKRLHVKASGHWLCDAETLDMFVELDLTKARKLASNGEEDLSQAVRGKSELRPSIETAMHALMPHPCVIHTHPISLIARSLLGEDAGLPVIEYCQPGAPLAAAMAGRIATGAPDTVLLANHGLVVGAETPEEAARRTRELAAGHELPVWIRPAGVAPLPKLSGFVPLAHPLANGVACTPDSWRVLGEAALVPDQVVYLGGPACIADSVEALPDALRAYARRTGTRPGLLLVKNTGAWISETASRGALAMAQMLVDLAARIPEGAEISTLGEEDEAALRNWDAEAHRQAVDRARTPEKKEAAA